MIDPAALEEALERFTKNLPEIIKRGDQEGIPLEALEGYAGDVVTLAAAARSHLAFLKSRVCENCGGSGAVADFPHEASAMHPCPSCGGSGLKGESE